MHKANPMNEGKVNFKEIMIQKRPSNDG
jgi:hypothetical protein